MKIESRKVLNANIERIKPYISRRDPNKILVHLLMDQDGERIELPLFSTSEIARLDLNRLDARLLCLDDHGARTDSEVRIYLQQQVAAELRAGRVGILFDRPGWTTLPCGRHVYVAGDRIIGDIGDLDYIIAPEVAAMTLPDQPEREAAEIVADFLSRLAREPNVLVLVAAQMFRAALNTTFEEIGRPMRHVMELVGEQGVGKTTAVNSFALPFTTVRGEIANSARALSSKAAVRDFLVARKDAAVLIDDVCTSTNAETQRKSAGLAAYLLRFAADNIAEMIKIGGSCRELRNEAGVIITGEFPMATPSDITRCAIVPVVQQMTGGKRDDRLVTASALSRFLAYFASDYEAQRAILAHALEEFDPTAGQDSSPRQQRILAELSAAFQIFLDFALKINAISEKRHRKWGGMVKEACQVSLYANNRLLNEYQKTHLTNVCAVLWEAVRDGRIRLAENMESYRKTPDSFDGFKAGDGRRMIKLVAIANAFEEASGRLCSPSAAGQLLRQAGLVEVGAENHTARAKFSNIGRFVSLKWKMVKKLAKN